jgi:transcriptional regulator with XRE-family HTH domain
MQLSWSGEVNSEGMIPVTGQDMYANLISSTLRAARQSAGLNQRQLAELVRTHPTRISRIEAGGEMLGLEKTKQFASVLQSEHRLFAQSVLQSLLAQRGVMYCVKLRRGVRDVNIGAEVKKLRLEQKLSLRDVAAELDVAPPRVAEIERGHKLLQPDTAVAVAEVLGVDPAIVLELALQDTVNRQCGLGFRVQLA